MTARRGSTLAEALCALVLALLVAQLAALTLGASRRAIERASALSDAERRSREALAILAREVRQSDTLALLGDTAIALTQLIATSVACATEPRALLLPPVGVSTGAPLTALHLPIEPGDRLSLLLPPDSTAAIGRWWHTRVDSVGSRTAPVGCGVSGGWVAPADASRPRTRLALRDTLPPDGLPGAPVRVVRGSRYVLYHAGTGEWMLGLRNCPLGGSCGSAQPVTGPFLTPGRGGMQLDSLPGGVGVALRGDTRLPALTAFLGRADAHR